MGIASRTVPEQPLDPTAPGPWSFGDADRVRSILNSAGWSEVELISSTGELLLGGGGTLEESVGFVVERGTVSSLLADSDEATAAKVRQDLTRELAPHHDGTALRMGYAAWIVAAVR